MMSSEAIRAGFYLMLASLANGGLKNSALSPVVPELVSVTDGGIKTSGFQRILLNATFRRRCVLPLAAVLAFAYAQ